MILRKSTLLSFFTFLMFQFFLSGQPLPLVEFNVSSGMGLQGSKVCLDVTVNNFIDVESVQFNLSYNASLIIPDTFILSSSALPFISNGNFNENNKTNGFVNFVWVNEATTIPDGSLLFTVCFTLIGEPGNISPIYFNGQLLDVEIGQLDGNGNSVNTDEIVSNVGTITIKANTLAVFGSTCDADANNVALGGSVTFYPTAGTPPYTYSSIPAGYTGTINNDGQRVTINNVPQGNYFIDITDANGSMIRYVFNISNNLPIKIDSSAFKAPTCVGKRNGFIEIKSVSGGLSPYRYEWSNLLSGLNTIEGLNPGIYTLTLTDGSGCRKIENFDLTIDTLDFDLVVKDSTACATARTGIITIENVTGGTPFPFGYQYVVNGFGNPKPFTSPLELTNLGVNTQIRVLDAVGCIVDKNIIVPFKKTVVLDTVEFKGITCFGRNDGSIRLRATPGQGYGYIPSANINDSGNQGGVFIANNLGPGSYSVIARDNNMCSDTLAFVMIEPEPININPVVVQPDCVNTGSITLSPSGGTGPFTYNWNPDVGNVSSQTGLTGGPISVTVTDANSCQESYSVQLNNVGSLSLTINTKDVSCNGNNDGSATVLPSFSGGTIPMFNVFWLDANGNDLMVRTNTIQNLAPGNYTVEVVTSDGCRSNPRPFVILDASSITIITNITNAACFDDLGRIEASVSGNNAGFTYEWRRQGDNSILSTTNVLNAKAGTYTVKAISPGGCDSEVEVMITQPSEINFPLPETRNVTCFGLSTGQAAILNGPQGINYTWSSGSMGPFAVNLPAGDGWVFASLGSCKSDTIFFNVGTFPPLSIDENKTIVVNPTCFGDTNGSVTIEASGGTGAGYVYNWIGGIPGPTLNNIPAGAYIINISDSNNCTQSDTFYLTQPDKLEAFLDRNRTIELDCNNQDKGKIALLTVGGNPGIKTINWQSGVITDAGVAIGLSSGTYCATISDNFGCLDTFCYTMIAPLPLVGEVNTPEEPLCNGGETCISVKTISGGTGNKYTFQINNGIRYPLDTCVTVFAGQYFINLIDSAGCSIDTVITIDQPEPILVEVGPDQDIQLGLPSPIINVSIDSPAGVDTIVWTPNIGVTCITSDCRSIEVSPSETTTYTVSVTDLNGCVATDEITINVKDIRNVYFANIFSPNRDGNNDFFQAVTGPGVERILSFVIFDRWGNRVFEKSNYMPDPAGTDGWDGTFGGKQLDPGVFVYHANALFIDGKVIEYSGSVTLADKVKN